MEKKFTKEQLENKQIHLLRQIGRELGVKSPSTLKKSQLIEQILGISSGEISPTFSKVGRPQLDGVVEKSKNKDEKNVEKELDQILELIKKFILKHVII